MTRSAGGVQPGVVESRAEEGRCQGEGGPASGWRRMGTSRGTEDEATGAAPGSVQRRPTGEGAHCGVRAETRCGGSRLEMRSRGLHYYRICL
jgi:hypothetical protein